MNKKILILSLTLIINLFSLDQCNPKITGKLLQELQTCAHYKKCKPHQRLLLLALTCCLKSEQEVITEAEQIYGDTNDVHLHKEKEIIHEGRYSYQQCVLVNDLKIIRSGDKSNNACSVLKQFVEKKENERIKQIQKNKVNV